MRQPLTLAILMTTATLMGSEVHVSPGGSDTGTGTKNAPYQTLGRAIKDLKPGDRCILGAGTYRETVTLAASGTAEAPITIEALPGERVILDGRDRIAGPWKPFRDGIHVTDVACGEAIEQVFLDDQPLMEARWPNATFQQRWERKTWTPSENGSQKDQMIAAGVKKTGIDWTGGYAVLNVAHQYKTLVREVKSQDDKGFTYDLGERLGDGGDSGKTWEDDFFYLFGKLEALDAPGEWFHDVKAGKLYLLPPAGDPNQSNLSFKVRRLAFQGEKVKHLRLTGLHFFATTVHLSASAGIAIKDCHFRFPAHSRLLVEQLLYGLYLEGTDNLIEHCSLSYSQVGGLLVVGQGNRITDCIVREMNWLGTIECPAIFLRPGKEDPIAAGEVSHCTVKSGGNIGIWYLGGENRILNNHVSDCGKMCEDIAAIHTGGTGNRGSICAYNWVHHSTGIGIRGDDQTRGLTVHHNVVWDCHRYGIIVKGDENRVYNNTILDRGDSIGLLIPTQAEPKKWWTPAPPLPAQNQNSLYANNVGGVLVWRGPSNPAIIQPKVHNWFLAVERRSPMDGDIANLFVDPKANSFSPKPGSPLIDAGKVIPGTDLPFTGKAPDLGAYEAGGEDWKAGASWTMEE